MPVTFATRVDSWDLMIKGLRTPIPDAPQLTAEQQEMETLLDQARGLQAEQELLRSRLRAIVTQRQETEKRGHELYSRVSSLLKGGLGFSSAQLIAYGLAPRKKRARKKEGGETVPAVASPASPQPKTTASAASPATE
jgi:hypothetical protein